ncbi:MAG: lipoyl(octanoyl) transferase LipB [Saprospiraceae bacterium]|nr:lipoyl(octanoyl) transferase LipB [Saprospiraceae bacterium]
MEIVRYKDLGRMRYQEAWDYQTSLHQALIATKMAHKGMPPESYTQEHHLLLVEHPPVYTLGKSGSMDHLLLSEQELSERGIEFFPINRGGDITYHGPGQIVGYPILDLERFFTDVHLYVRNIEEVIIRTLADYNIESYRIKEYTGVWTQTQGTATQAPMQRKICAIGVHLSRWTTLHGWAFNVNTELDYFRNIVPCGINDDDKTVTSMAQLLGREMDMEEVKQKIKKYFEEVFQCRLEE